MTVERTPLAGFAARFASASAGSGGALRLQEEPLWTQVNLRIDPAAAGSLTDVLNGPLPLEPNTVTPTANGQIVWLGPDEWLLLRPNRPSDAEAVIRAAAGSTPVSVVDVSAARAVVRLSGPAVREVLAHGCGLDLDAAQFPPGACAQTRIALTDVILIAPHDQSADFAFAPTFLVLARASFAPYLATWLLDAATEHVSAAPHPG